MDRIAIALCLIGSTVIIWCLIEQRMEIDTLQNQMSIVLQMTGLGR